jgi:hypothetical protein
MRMPPATASHPHWSYPFTEIQLINSAAVSRLKMWTLKKLLFAAVSRVVMVVATFGVLFSIGKIVALQKTFQETQASDEQKGFQSFVCIGPFLRSPGRSHPRPCIRSSAPLTAAGQCRCSLY